MMCKFKIKIAEQSMRLSFFGKLYSLYRFFSFLFWKKCDFSDKKSRLVIFVDKMLYMICL